MRVFLLFLGTLLLLNSCSKDEPEADHTEVPVILLPETGRTFYPNQLIELRWSVPDSMETVEMQTLSSTNSHYFDDAESRFDALESDDFIPFSETSRDAYYMEGLTDVLYYAWRIRYNDSGNRSAWTPIQFYQVAPISVLTLEMLTLEATFNFTAEHVNDDISGVVTSNETFDLNALLEAEGLDKTKLVYIKPNSGYIEDHSGNGTHIDGMAFGFNPVVGEFYPFDVWGGTYAIQGQTGITFSPFGGIYRDLYEEIGGKSIHMKAAYQLDVPFQELEDMLGKPHDIVIHLELNCYFTQ